MEQATQQEAVAAPVGGSVAKVTSPQLDALRDDLDKAVGVQADLEAKVMQCRQNLREGRGGPEQITMAQRELEAHRLIVAELTGACEHVEAELTIYRAKENKEAARVERERQIKAASWAPVQADQLVSQFVEQLVGLRKLLVQRKRIAAESAAASPLAPQIAPLELDALVHLFKASYTGPGAEAVCSGPHHKAICNYLLMVLGGPLTSASTNAQTITECFLKE